MRGRRPDDEPVEILAILLSQIQILAASGGAAFQ
jgi:hypothetical protein